MRPCFTPSLSYFSSSFCSSSSSSMGAWTIRLLRCVSTERRLHVAAYGFWITLILGIYCTFFVAKGGFEMILMAISWLAVTLTCIDVILTADVRDNEE